MILQFQEYFEAADNIMGSIVILCKRGWVSLGYRALQKPASIGDVTEVEILARFNSR